jgi:hypothetical protein
MTVRYLAATEFLIDHLSGGGNPPPPVALSELAVSAVSLEWILVDVETSDELSPGERSKWRTNVTNFRKLLVQSGGSVTAVSEQTLEEWRKAMLLDLTHDHGEGPEEMSSEERLVVATASELGLIYLTPRRDWNEALRDEYGLAIQEA